VVYIQTLVLLFCPFFWSMKYFGSRVSLAVAIYLIIKVTVTVTVTVAVTEYLF
jgi:hypothetical protein